MDAPTSEEEMQEICSRVLGYHLANMLEEGATPILFNARLHEIGFKLVAHPFTVFGASISAMKEALRGPSRGMPAQSARFVQRASKDRRFRRLLPRGRALPERLELLGLRCFPVPAFSAVWRYRRCRRSRRRTSGSDPRLGASSLPNEESLGPIDSSSGRFA